MWRAFAGARPSHERDAISMGDGNSTFSVLTLNTWVGDERRGYCSQDTERRGWIARQLREADPDVMCLQEVLELSVQTWFEETFPDYEFTAQHMSTTSSVAVAVWHLIVGLPACFSALVLYCAVHLVAVLSGGEAVSTEWRARALAGLCAIGARFLVVHILSSPAWKISMRWAQIGGFPFHGSYEYASSTNASVMIGVRRSWGKVVGVEEEWLEEKGHWWNYTKAGQEREELHFNPDRWLNLMRHRGILAVDVETVGASLPLRFVNIHLNIGVTNPIVRQVQLEQVVAALARYEGGPQVICGDTNSCADMEPEMAWLLRQSKCPLVDSWLASGTEAVDARPGWTWDRENAMTVGGPLLEPDQRLDVILHTCDPCPATGNVLLATACKVHRYPKTRLISDHYAVQAVLGLASNAPPSRSRSNRVSGDKSHRSDSRRRKQKNPSPSADGRKT